MTALDTLRAMSAGCTESWDLYLRTRGIDLDVTSGEWGEVAESIELSAGAEKVVAWAAAQRSLLCWMMTVNRRLDRRPQVQGGPQTEEEIDAAVMFLTDGALIDSRDVTDLDDDELRKFWVSLALAVGPGELQDDEPEHPLNRLCRGAEAQLDQRGLIPKVLSHPREYRGEKRLSVDVKETVFRGGSPRLRSTSKEWVAFFLEKRDILHVDFPMRLPKAVFSALKGQPELLSISMMWSDIADLSVLRSLPNLRRLELDTGVPATDLDPIGDLHNLEHLELRCRAAMTDFSALGRLKMLETLTLVPSGKVESLDFIRTMTSLRRFDLFGRVRDRDYSALIDRADLEWVRLRPERGMTPTTEELRRSVPGLVLFN